MITTNMNYFPALINNYVSYGDSNAFNDTKLIYSLRRFPSLEDTNKESLLEAIQKSLKVCHAAGINSAHHFKKIFLFDSSIETLVIDWRMSRTGLNLLIIQIPSEHERLANWVWQLANHA